ncbi:MAG: response regulator transcription factor [Methylobacterium mesophilicum]|nr:response regulator transcription factor [Methylobacterium mesophilicum]
MGETEARPTLVVVDDHPLYRSGVVRTLLDDGRFDVVGEGASADEAVALVSRLKPTLALLDISMPGNGVEAARRIREAAPGTYVAMLTVSESDADIMGAIEAGAKGYVLKGVDAEELLDVVATVAEGDSYVSPRLAARLLRSMKSGGGLKPEKASPLDALTERETEILRLVADGLSNKEVGRKLTLQEKTVKHYMTNVLQKLHVRNRTEAAVLARESWRKD